MSDPVSVINKSIVELCGSFGKLLYACESGSRLWGFESPDSDYDIRFVYSLGLKSSLSFKNEHSDYAHIDGLYDFRGVELKKFITLLLKHDVACMEWLLADKQCVYHTNKYFKIRAVSLIQKIYNPLSAMHHYNGLSKKFRKTISENNYTIKDVCYFLRAYLNVLYVELQWKKGYGQPPPPNAFSILDINMQSIPPKIYSFIFKFFTEKKTKNENDVMKIDSDVYEYICTYLDMHQNRIQNLSTFTLDMADIYDTADQLYMDFL